MATTNFLQINNAAINQESDAQYSVDPIRTGGAAVTGELPSPLFNKFAYQSSTFYTAFAQMMANKGFSTSDADINVLSAVLANVQTSADVKPLQAAVAYSPTPVFDCSLASSFRFSLNGNVASSTLINVPPAGGIITFFIVSASPGNLSFAWPANVLDAFIVQTESLSNLFAQQFISDGTNLFPVDTFLNVLNNTFNAQVIAQDNENTALANLGNTAVINAATAQATANTAVSNAATAQGTANTALSNAATAQGSANTALSEIAALQVVYTRNDVTGSRNFNQTYTNPYGMPMAVTGYGTTTGSRVASVQCFVNGVGDFANTDGATVDGGACGFSFEVPTGATYEVVINSLSGGQTGVTGMGKWIETTKSL